MKEAFRLSIVPPFLFFLLCTTCLQRRIVKQPDAFTIRAVDVAASEKARTILAEDFQKIAAGEPFQYRELEEKLNLQKPWELMIQWRYSATSSRLEPDSFKVVGPVLLDCTDLDGRPSLVRPQESPYHSVSFRFTDHGSEIFRSFTKANIDKPMSIASGRNIYLLAIIRAEIFGPAGEISGSFSKSSAQFIINQIEQCWVPR